LHRFFLVNPNLKDFSKKDTKYKVSIIFSTNILCIGSCVYFSIELTLGYRMNTKHDGKSQSFCGKIVSKELFAFAIYWKPSNFKLSLTTDTATSRPSFVSNILNDNKDIFSVHLTCFPNFFFIPLKLSRVNKLYNCFI
jgi:hypothetical protein